jgi:hypothetical protein
LGRRVSEQVPFLTRHAEEREGRLARRRQ